MKDTIMKATLSSSAAVELVFVNNSSYDLSFTPQLILLTPAANGAATLSSTNPVNVPSGQTSSSVIVTMTPVSGEPVTVTLELDGTIGGTAFAMIQTFGVPPSSLEPTAYSLTNTWPLSATPVLAPSSTGGELKLTIDAGFALPPATKFSIEGSGILLNGLPFFACGVDYAPTPIGGATFKPGVGDWFTPPWWTGAAPDIGSRDIPLLQAASVNAVRTYYSWFWRKRNDLTYLQGITQTTPMSVFTNTEYPYTVAFDHTPFLNACYANNIYAVLGISIEGGNCFNFNNPPVSAAYQNFYLQTAQKLASLYGNHPAVLGFCMGNEQNNPTVNVDSRTWLYYQSMYQAIKAVAPDKLVLIAFQDDQSLYNGTTTVIDQANQEPPTPFNNLPIEQAVSMVVDVWGLNIYSGIPTDFPIFQANVVKAKNGAYARPLFITEWGTPAGQNIPAGAPGPITGNAQGQELSPSGLQAGAQVISSAVAAMQINLSFVAGAFYFEFTDEWWKNTSFNSNKVNTAISPLNPETMMYQTNANGQVTMLDGSLVYPAYPFVHDGSEDPNWPEEWWGLYAVSAADGREPYAPVPGNPDTLTARTPYVSALSTAYKAISAANQTALQGTIVSAFGSAGQWQAAFYTGSPVPPAVVEGMFVFGPGIPPGTVVAPVPPAPAPVQMTVVLTNPSTVPKNPFTVSQQPIWLKFGF